MAGGAILAWSLAAGSAGAQPPYRQEVLTGLSALDLGDYSSPALADLDDDGDLDAVISGAELDTPNPSTQLRYFENVGSPFAAILVERIGTADPLDGLNPGLALNPTLIDLDGDGDLDLVTGDLQAVVHFFENAGTAAAPAFEPRTGAANPFDDLDLAPTAGITNPHLLDLDDDGDPDMVLSDGTWMRYFENTGSLIAPTFERRNGAANPFNVAGIAGGIGVDTGDLDDDGDFDAVLGYSSGLLALLENTGSASAPVFVTRTGAANPFDGFSVSSASDPGIGDLDGDGTLDVTVGQRFGLLLQLQNTGTPQAPAFVALRREASPFGDGYVGGRSDPVMADLDGDSDLDGVVGDAQGHLHYFENTGSPAASSFVERIGVANPFVGLDFGFHSSSDLIDLDGDLDLDAVIGDSTGDLHYFENVGSLAAPSFVELIGPTNPFDGFDVGIRSKPDLSDLDEDGDLDAVIGEQGGMLTYFENTGSAIAPTFVPRIGASNPFDGFDVGFDSSPELADLDADGDFDAIVGNEVGDLAYFENTGSTTSPAFVERTGAANPVAGLRFDNISAIGLSDLDLDGDLDALVGQELGALVFLRSSFAENLIFRDGFESADTTAWSATVPP